MISLLLACSMFGTSAGDFTLINNALIYDGSGSKPYRGRILLKGSEIEYVGTAQFKLSSATVIDAKGYAVAPGFIDSHSHADRGLKDDPSAESQIRQGITTAVVGQDGGWSEPFSKAMSRLIGLRPSLNYAAFAGHGGIRDHILGTDFKRVSTAAEISQMKEIVEQDMKSGALGLSSGLEYDPGFFSNTNEVIELAKIASQYHGIYISHVRNEDKTALQAFTELIQIAREAKLPAQISHIKLGLPMVWGRSKEVIEMVEKARKSGLDITADIYPYPYWQSTITVITASRDWDNVKTWKDAIDELGGADKILLSNYTENRAWQGKRISQISSELGKKPEEIVHEIVMSAYGPGKDGSASVIVTAMCEPDIMRFMKWEHTSICSDGGIGGSHPRGAGSFPRVLHRYVAQLGLMPLEEAIRKMTSLPAKRFGWKKRGVLRKGAIADLVIFNPNKIRDLADPSDSKKFSIGVEHVVVAGRFVLRDGKMTKERPGRIVTRTESAFHPIPILDPTPLHSTTCCEGG